MSHLDDAQLDAYLAGRAEFADRAARREAGRHIADCPECRHRLRHAWSGHPESIDHPIGPAGRPSWPLLKVSGPIAPPAVPPHGHGPGQTSGPSRQRRRSTEARRSEPREQPHAAQLVIGAPEEAGDPLNGTPWPALIAALEAVLRPKSPEPAAPPPPLRPTRTGAWAADEIPAAIGDDEGIAPELIDHSGDMPALDLDLTKRYQTRAERSRRRARRRQALVAVAMLILAVLLAGAVLKVGAAALDPEDPWRGAPAPFVTPAEVPSTTLFESASALQAFAESLRTAADSLNSTSTIVASVLHPDVREAINDPTWGESVPEAVPETTAVAPPRARTPAPTKPEPAAARPAAPTAKGPELPPTRRASSRDAALATGEWQVTDAVSAERLLRHNLLLIPDLGLESVAKPGASDGPFVRIAQVTRAGERVAIVLSRAETPPGSPQAPPGLGAVRVIPATDANAPTMAMARWGGLLVTLRADLPADSLRSLMGRLREVRD